MFKDLYAFMDADYDAPVTAFEKTFFAQLTEFAFFVSLDETCKSLYAKGAEMMCSEGRYKEVVAALLYPEGLNYGNMPKGLLLFHRYPEGNRTRWVNI